MAVMAIGFVMAPRDLAADPDCTSIGVCERQTRKAKQCQKEGAIELSILSEMWPYNLRVTPLGPSGGNQSR